MWYYRTRDNEYADMAELADALDSGSSGSNTVQVQVLLSAPNIVTRESLLSNRLFRGIMLYIWEQSMVHTPCSRYKICFEREHNKPPFSRSRSSAYTALAKVAHTADSPLITMSSRHRSLSLFHCANHGNRQFVARTFDVIALTILNRIAGSHRVTSIVATTE